MVQLLTRIPSVGGEWSKVTNNGRDAEFGVETFTMINPSSVRQLLANENNVGESYDTSIGKQVLEFGEYILHLSVNPQPSVHSIHGIFLRFSINPPCPRPKPVLPKKDILRAWTTEQINWLDEATRLYHRGSRTNWTKVAKLYSQRFFPPRSKSSLMGRYRRIPLALPHAAMEDIEQGEDDFMDVADFWQIDVHDDHLTPVIEPLTTGVQPALQYPGFSLIDHTTSQKNAFDPKIDILPMPYELWSALQPSSAPTETQPIPKKRTQAPSRHQRRRNSYSPAESQWLLSEVESFPHRMINWKLVHFNHSKHFRGERTLDALKTQYAKIQKARREKLTPVAGAVEGGVIQGFGASDVQPTLAVVGGAGLQAAADEPIPLAADTMDGEDGEWGWESPEASYNDCNEETIEKLLEELMAMK